MNKQEDFDLKRFNDAMDKGGMVCLKLVLLPFWLLWKVIKLFFIALGIGLFFGTKGSKK